MWLTNQPTIMGVALCQKSLDAHALDTTNQQDKFNQYHTRSWCTKTSPSDTCMHQLWGNMCMVMLLSYLSRGQQLEHCVKWTIILVRCHHHCREQVFIHVDFIIWIGWAFWSVLCCLRVLLSSLCSRGLTSLQHFFHFTVSFFKLCLNTTVWSDTTPTPLSMGGYTSEKHNGWKA